MKNTFTGHKIRETEDDQTAQEVVSTAAKNALVHRIVSPRKLFVILDIQNV